MLGNLLGLPGFDYDSSEQVRAEALGDAADARIAAVERPVGRAADADGASRRCRAALERVADVPIYCADALVRRVAPLQLTRRCAAAGRSACRARCGSSSGLRAATSVRVAQGDGGCGPAGACSTRRWPTNVVRVAGRATPATAALGAMFGPITRREEPDDDARHRQQLRQLAARPGRLWPVAWTLIKIVALVLPLMLCVAYLTLWERKAIGWMQIRPGPNRVGPLGLLQPIADAVKLIFKEIIRPTAANKRAVLPRRR